MRPRAEPEARAWEGTPGSGSEGMGREGREEGEASVGQESHSPWLLWEAWATCSGIVLQKERSRDDCSEPPPLIG